MNKGARLIQETLESKGFVLVRNSKHKIFRRADGATFGFSHGNIDSHLRRTILKQIDKKFPDKR
jgi:predicted RNA binding protein YcfA (HicA-like mRNA interferase family)